MAFTTIFFCHSTPSISHLQRWKHPFIKNQSFKFPLQSSKVSFQQPYTATVFGQAAKFPSIINNRSVQRLRDESISSSSNINVTVANDAILDDQPISVAKSELDRPKTEGFSFINEAIEDIRQGKMVLVVDDEDGENGGGLIMAAEAATMDTMAFILKHGTGIVYVGMKGENPERLQIPLMMDDHRDNQEMLSTAFTIAVDGRNGTTSKFLAEEMVALASEKSKPYDFKRSRHIYPLRYKAGGVSKRKHGHIEASVNLADFAGLNPVGILCEVVDDDGSIATLPKLRQFAQHHNLKIISIANLIGYKRKRETFIKRIGAPTRLPTTWGSFNAYCYKSTLDGIEHMAMVKGDVGDGEDILVRVHSECFTGDIFGSARCDCGKQLALAMQYIEAAGKGVLVYLRGQEGRGIGLGNKLLAYNLQDAGRDTVEANEDLGLPIDSRDYSVGAQILRDLGVRTMKLMTNNPAKYMGLKGYGLAVSGRVPLVTPITKDNKRYLETKRAKMGHIYGLEFNGGLNGLMGINKK